MIQLIFVCLFINGIFPQLSPPIVKTPLGYVKGKHIKSYEGRTAIAFEGVPYGKPPVGELRFKDPEPIQPWLDTVSAERSIVCMQYTLSQPIRDVVGTEDCLYVNIYIPREKITGDEDLDVVIHFHGGGYTVGDPKSYASGEYMVDRDLVYVGVGYRVGILGFLSTQDDIITGNFGLKDQVLAMKWVKNNIRSFGGNPDSITITGASAGAGAVQLHYLSPLSRGLFHRGLSQSGTALNMWNLNKNPVKQAKKLGEVLGCSSVTSQELVNCLKFRSAREVVMAHNNFTKLANALPVAPFGPVIEYGPNPYLTDHPYRMLLEGKIYDVPWITSNVRDEGIVAVAQLLLHKDLAELENRWEELLPHILGYEDSTDDIDKPFIANVIRSYYLRNKPLSLSNIDNLIRLITDRFLIVDGLKSVCLHSEVAQSPVYYYYFDHLIDMPILYKANLSVVAHEDDSRLLFRHYDNSAILSKNDRKMKNIFLDFIYRYASTGVPDFRAVHWKPFNSPTEQSTYMYISSPNLIRQSNVINPQSLLFWSNLPIRENEKLFSYSYVNFHRILY